MANTAVMAAVPCTRLAAATTLLSIDGGARLGTIALLAGWAKARAMPWIATTA